MSRLSVVLQTHDFLSQRDLPNVRFSVDSLRWTARGGPEWATITAEGDLAALEELIGLCGDPVIVYDELGTQRWWGYVHEATVQRGAIEYGATLEGMANVVAVAYDNGSGRATTSWAQDGESINRYGSFEKLFTTTSRTAAQCEQLRQTKLNLLAHPLPIVRDNPGGEGHKGTLSCKGWYGTLNRRYYDASELKQEYLSTVPGALTLDSFYDWQWGDAYQFITFAGTAPRYLDSAAFIFQAEGSAPTLTVTLYDATGAVTPADLAPGDVLATATLTRASAKLGEFTPLSFRDGSGNRLLIQPSAHLAFKFSSAQTTQTWYLCYGPVSNSNTLWKTRWPGGTYENNWDNGALQTAYYRLSGFADTAQQVAEAVTAKGEFIAGVDQVDASGIQTDPVREGEQRLGDLVEDLLDTGSVNNLRMLCTVTEDRRLQIWEEPSPDVDAVAYLKRADGQIEDRRGNVVSPATNLAGQWCLRQEAVPPLSSAPPTESALIFVEACEYSGSDDSLSIEPRTLPDLFSFFDLEDG